MASNKPNADMVVKFGIKQLSNPTPVIAKTIFRTVSFLVGIWALVQHLNLGLSKDVVHNINEWAIAIVPIMHFTIKFWGWDYATDKPDTDNP